MAESRVALVTGASRGIGRGIALALAEAGMRVAVNYAYQAEAARDTLEQVRQRGSDGALFQADISRAEQRDRLVDSVLARFGRIDVLVNNAGIAPRIRADILEATEESFDELMAVNLKGPYFLTQRVAKEMIRLVTSEAPAQRPKIITITSMSAYAASVNRGDYCISKAGLSMMTKLFAVRLAPYGIGVFEVRPGIIATDMTAKVKERYDQLFAQGLTPIARWGTPEDVGKVVALLATGELPYSTGEVINVDGGFHIQRL